MNNFLKTIIAGYGAKKLGGGCISTILVFIIIYWALGNCGSNRANTNAPAHTFILKKPATIMEVQHPDKKTYVYLIENNVAA